MLDNMVVADKDTAEIRRYLDHGEIDWNVRIDSLVCERRKVTCDTVKLNSRGLIAEITIGSPRVLFFSIPNDEGFTATIDGNPARIFRANLGLSALVVSAGHHTIRFTYFPPGLKYGCWMSLAGLLLLILVYRRGGLRKSYNG